MHRIDNPPADRVLKGLKSIWESYTYANVVCQEGRWPNVYPLEYVTSQIKKKYKKEENFEKGN